MNCILKEGLGYVNSTLFHGLGILLHKEVEVRGLRGGNEQRSNR